MVASASDWFTVCEPEPKSLTVYQDLSMPNDWPVKEAIVNFPIRLKGNAKRTFGKYVDSVGDPDDGVGVGDPDDVTRRS